jgi:uncharacterized membrane protein
LNRFVGTCATVLLVMLTLDALWLGLLAKPMYQQDLGHLMAEEPRLGVAMLFYAVYAAGITIFAVGPVAATPGWAAALRMGALFGFFCYATYDLTNLATLKGWPLGITLIDLAWGTAISGVSAAAGKWASDRLSA